MHSPNQQATRRVLIADDDPVVRHWLTTILESDRYQVVSMNDGRDAFRILKDDADFAGAVFDLSMPYLQGPDLIRYMRTEKRLMKIPVLIITAETAVDALTICFSAGATVVLPKPFTKQRLQQTLRMILNDSSIGNQSAAAATAGNPRRSFSPPPASQPIVDRDQQKTPNQMVDLSILSDLADPQAGEDGLIIELIDLYLENSTLQVAEIKSAVEANKPQLLRQTAHALKGSSLTIGARRVGSLCEQIEQEQIGSPMLAELLMKLDAALASTAEAFQIERRHRLVPVAA